MFQVEISATNKKYSGTFNFESAEMAAQKVNRNIYVESHENVLDAINEGAKDGVFMYGYFDDFAYVREVSEHD